MANLLFSWELGRGLGHLMPLRQLATELLPLGHRVVLAARDGRLAAEVFAGLDVTVCQAPVSTVRPHDRFLHASIFAHVLLASGFGDSQDLSQRCNRWNQIFDAVQPDFALFDHSPTAITAARGRSFPRATIGNGFCCPPDQEILPNWRPWMNLPVQQLIADEQAVCSNINAVVAPTAAVDRIGQLYNEVDRTFLLTYAEMDHFPERQGAEYFGAFPDQPGLVPTWPKTEGTRVFAYLTSTPALPILLEQIGSLNTPTIAYSAAITESMRAVLEGRYPSMRLPDRPVDVRQAAQQSDVCVHHGSHGVATSVLLAGKPAAVFPTQLEQRVTCVNLHRLGAGRMANPYRPDEIHAAICDVMSNDLYRQHASHFAAKYSNVDRAETLQATVNEICRLAGES